MTTRPEPKWRIEDGFRPLWKEAPDLKHWPPLGYRSAQKVRLGLDWLSIAHMNLIVDAWDLIHFNFRTEDPREVNWYMRHYIGCWAGGPDWKNFKFTNYDATKAADSGQVYIPPLGYKRGLRMPFHGRVVAELEKAITHYPLLAWKKSTSKNFSVGTETYRKTLQAMRDGRIYTFYDPTIKDNAQYVWHENRMLVRRASFARWDQRATLVHEMTHAILDYKKYTMFNWESEMMAYAAEGLWARAVNNKACDRYVASDIVHADVFHNALVLARYLGERKDRVKRLEDIDVFVPHYLDARHRHNPVNDLMMAIQHSKTYAKHAWKEFTRDGMDKVD